MCQLNGIFRIYFITVWDANASVDASLRKYRVTVQAKSLNTTEKEDFTFFLKYPNLYFQSFFRAS